MNEKLNVWQINRDSTYKNLLREFTDYRWLIMLQCADRCDEIGSPDGKKMALVWRWLAKWKRWPAPRLGEKFGWTFKDEMVKRYPHGLPKIFEDLTGLRQAEKYDTEQHALSRLVHSLFYNVLHYRVFTDENYMNSLIGIKTQEVTQEAK